MNHLCAYSTSIATGVETELTPVTDGILPINNSHLVPQDDVNILWAAAMATNLQRSRLYTPQLQRITTPFIRGQMQSLVPNSPAQVAGYRENPLPLRRLEEIVVYALQNAAGAQRVTVLLGLEIRPNPPAVGRIYTIRGSSTTAAVANSWTQLSVTWNNALPNGKYQVVGLQVQSTNAQAARLTFQGQTFRPGCMSQAALGDVAHPYFLKGGLGVMGTFDNYTFPIVEVLANGADAAHDIYLDIVPLMAL